MLPHCILCKTDTHYTRPTRPSHKLHFKSYKLFFFFFFFSFHFWLTASEKRILQNKGGPSSSQSKHNSWSESLSSAIRLMPGRNTKEMTYKSEVTSPCCLFCLCHLLCLWYGSGSLSWLTRLLCVSVGVFLWKLDTHGCWGSFPRL